MKIIRYIFSSHKHILISLLLLGAFLYFYNSNWGAPFYFHPDERNIASAVTQIRFPTEMNPHFFAYGSLPIYVIYFIGVAFNSISFDSSIYHVNFPQAILISRLLSAFFALALIPLVYSIGRKLQDSTTGIISAGLVALNPGIIQFAHFGTYEMWLTFFSTLLFWCCLKIIKYNSIRFFVYASFILGILFSIKITSLILFPVPFIAYGIHLLKKSSPLKKIIQVFSLLIISGCSITVVYTATNPYVFIDTPAFISSMNYETAVGLGKLPVFYTQTFYETIPILYQITHIFPFLINPIMTIVSLIGVPIILYLYIQQKNIRYGILLCFFFLLFLSQSFLFIKWTRNMVPTLPFLFLIIALVLSLAKNRLPHVLFVLFSINALFSLSFFITAYVMPDSRVTAYANAVKIMPKNARILSEMYDLGITPYNSMYPNITLFNTYDTDANSTDFNYTTWKTALTDTDYIILPSQRVLQSRLQNEKRFPVGNRIYTQLLTETSNFKKIYETPCNIFCQITYLGDPLFRYEQTTAVFDRPTVIILKKQ